MKKHFSLLALSMLLFFSCENNLRDISGIKNPVETVTVEPVDINIDGFDFLEKMQGHWVGTNMVITDEYPWFAWDYRAISKSHIQGIHEGGSMGNLFTSFFVTNYKNKRTIMARNGGLLNGIYRTSYFVLDKVETLAVNDKKYRFVDAIGNKDIMHFEIRFKDNEIFFNVYTSGLGARIPSRHMTFKGKKEHLSLAQTAANETNFPKNEVEIDFANGFREDYLYVETGADKAKSATFLAQSTSNDVYSMAIESGDPYTITDHPKLGSIQIDISRNNDILDSNLFVYLSKEPLTNTDGQLTSNTAAFNSILHFPTLTEKENSFLFTYIHPGSYYLTIIADKNNDLTISNGDITNISTAFTLNNKEHKTLSVNNINYQN
ncbi:hypothetical protein [Polaribacter sp. Z022]|uniref:hypothetical protein n=1 Tax=Polaribacter sp. Z022 TaxID=2927125 RepID=UPI002022378B|nr:hypothetical protein [Polaribacter sp. Z022]MCL7752150.1 hypothetical protein [Polaribacter sp. Z022]